MAGLIGEWEEGVLRKLGLRDKNDGCSCFAEDGKVVRNNLNLKLKNRESKKINMSKVS